MSKLVLRGVFILALLSLVLPASSQVQNGEFTGLITDPSGAVVNQARVVIHNLGTGYTLELRSNDAGIYTARELIVGQYQITVQVPGFRTSTSGALTLNAGTEVRADFRLQVGAPQEVVEVTDAAVTVNTENARLSQTVDSTQIANLPLNGRNVYDLIQYTPGATNMRGTMFENGANTVVNGVRENFNGFVINGVSNKGLSGGPVNQPIQDTVQEFQTLTLNNSAEFGNSAGAITNLVTKSGTNTLHGSVWEYFRNDALDANPFFANHFQDPAQRQKTPLHLNQFGGTVGGPILKNKLFFLAAYQGDRFIISNPGQVLAESSEFRQAVNAAFPNSIAGLLYSNFAPANSGSQAFTLREYVRGGSEGPISGFGFTNFGDYLCPNPDSTGITNAISNNFAALFGVEQADIDYMNMPDNCPSGSPYSTPQAGAFGRDLPFLVNVLNVGKSQVSENLFNGNEASLRLDYNLSAKDRIFGQFNWSKAADQFAGGEATQLRGFYTPSTITTPNFQFSYIHAFTPTVLNEFRAGYAGNGQSAEAPLPGVPSIGFADGTVGFGSYNGYPLFFHENIYNYVDVISVSHGKHNLKGGAEIRRNIENSDWNMGRPSYYFFDPIFFAVDQPYLQANGVDPGFVSGQPAQLATSVRHWRNWEFGSFFQDDWKITKRLTLNLGLRYDLYTRHTELNHLATTFLKGPGQHLIDDIATGAGQIQSANVPCPGDPRGILAGECGPGGFAPSRTLGKGDHNDFGPRVGFAWDLLGDGKTSLRGGFGISYEGTLYNPLSNTRWNPPYYSVDGVENALGDNSGNIVYGPVGGGTPTFLGPSPPAQHAGVGVQATGNISGWDPSNPHLAINTAIVFPEGIRDPYVENWFFGVQREIRPRLSVEVNYVGTAGHKLLRAESVNRVPGGALPEGVCVQDTFGRRLCSQINDNNPNGVLNPNYRKLRVWENVANSNYNGLQLSLKHQMSHGLQFAGNYTWSHSMDSGSNWHSGLSSANGFAGGDGFTTDQTLPQLDRGNSVFDIRHRLTFNFVWEMPFLRDRHDLVGMVLGGWQLNGIFSLQTGAHWSPFRGGQLASSNLQPDNDNHLGACDPATFDPLHCVNVGADYNLDGVANDRPNAIANHVDATHQQWADGFNLPNTFFSAPCLGCVGNLGRNTFVGPGYWNLDTSLFKNFRLSDRFRLQFRAEAFNIFNHTNFQLGVANSGSSGNNRLQLPEFGKAGGTFNPRNLQFGMKLNF
jgi:outer membrane receptor protein involved in Fe transport